MVLKVLSQTMPQSSLLYRVIQILPQSFNFPQPICTMCALPSRHLDSYSRPRNMTNHTLSSSQLQRASWKKRTNSETTGLEEHIGHSVLWPKPLRTMCPLGSMLQTLTHKAVSLPQRQGSVLSQANSQDKRKRHATWCRKHGLGSQYWVQASLSHVTLGKSITPSRLVLHLQTGTVMRLLWGSDELICIRCIEITPGRVNLHHHRSGYYYHLLPPLCFVYKGNLFFSLPPPCLSNILNIKYPFWHSSHHTTLTQLAFFPSKHPRLSQATRYTWWPS
jgi:hypothetical protein